MDKHINKFVLVWALALTAFLAMGVTIPNTFVGGTTISSAQMNANFAAVKAAVDVLETQNASPGTCVGWLWSTAAGSITSSWMANGGTPVMTKGPAGAYDIDWPGESVNITNRPVIAVRTNSIGEIRIGSSSGTLQVRTADSSGAAADNQFAVFIFNN